MRYRLRSLLIALALSPPLLAMVWSNYAAWKAEQARLAAQAQRRAAFTFVRPALTTNPRAQQGTQATSEAVFSFYIGISR